MFSFFGNNKETSASDNYNKLFNELSRRAEMISVHFDSPGDKVVHDTKGTILENTNKASKIVIGCNLFKSVDVYDLQNNNLLDIDKSHINEVLKLVEVISCNLSISHGLIDKVDEAKNIKIFLDKNISSLKQLTSNNIVTLFNSTGINGFVYEKLSIDLESYSLIIKESKKTRCDYNYVYALRMVSLILDIYDSYNE